MNFKQLEMNVDRQPNGCWIWKNIKTKSGFPQWQVCGPSSRGHLQDMVKVSARRLVWALFEDVVPADRKVVMTCSSPSCVSPSHMELREGKAWSLTGK